VVEQEEQVEVVEEVPEDLELLHTLQPH